MSRIFDDLYEKVARLEHYRTHTANTIAASPMGTENPIQLLQLTDEMLRIERNFHDGIIKGYTAIGKGHLKPRRPQCPICGSLECLEREYLQPPDIPTLLGVLQ